jgi:2-polyprenyl-3-methyl-5-hydroxy-6-metoxy-1,4-benzoquinol methylase
MAALDLATGRGRHASVLAAAGFKTFAVDRDVESLHAVGLHARSQRLSLTLWAADLEHTVLPASRFDLLVCTRYLQRNLFAALGDAIKPGGIVLYETFTVRQRQHGTGPRSPDHLLEPLELRKAFSGWTELEYDEVDKPEALARLAARKPQLPTVGW